ncbi:MAG TPA: hypothetical protein VGK38_00500 [Prolixibacteraceae bacterium]
MLKNVLAGRILTSIIVIFILSSVTLLSSCTAYVRTPRHVRTNVVIESQVRSGHHDNGLHRGQIERREKREKRHHRDND